MEHLGKIAFIAGVALAILAGFVTATWIPLVLAVLGLVVGGLNITAEETRGFLLAAIALIVAASAIQPLPYVGDTLTTILGNLVTFLAAAVLVVALKSLFESARD